MRKIKDNSIVLAIILLSLILILFYRNLATNLIHDMYQILSHYKSGNCSGRFLMKTLNMMKVLNYIWVHRSESKNDRRQ